MTPEEEFSTEIEKVVGVYRTGWTGRVLCRIMYRLLRYKNTPLPFRWVGDEGEPVGKPMKIRHLMMHDMMPHAAEGAMTGKVLLEGVRVNAIQKLKFKRIAEMVGETTIQPRWV